MEGTIDETRVRPAASSDYPRWLLLRAQLGSPDRPPDESTWGDEWAGRTLVAERHDELLGYCSARGLSSEIYFTEVVVDKWARRRGIAKTLFVTMAARFPDAERWRLNVRSDNHGAFAFYRRLGLTQQHQAAIVHVPWSLVERLPPPTLRTAELPEAQQDELERGFNLPPGRLGSVRRGDFHLMLTEDDDGPRGLAAFSPSFPGAYPFRARDAEATEALLSAMYEVRARDTRHTGLVIEDHEGVVEHLVELGAEVQYRMRHLAGPVVRDTPPTC